MKIPELHMFSYIHNCFMWFHGTSFMVKWLRITDLKQLNLSQKEGNGFKPHLQSRLFMWKSCQISYIGWDNSHLAPDMKKFKTCFSVKLRCQYFFYYLYFLQVKTFKHCLTLQSACISFPCCRFVVFAYSLSIPSG